MPGQATAVREVLQAIATRPDPRLAAAQDALGRRSPEVDTGFDRRWADARASWREAVEAVDARIAKVRAKMLSSGNPDLLDIADRGLPALTDNHKTPVSVAVLEVADSSGEKRERSARQAMQAIQAFRAHIDTDPMIKVLDEQSSAAFGVSLAIRADIGRGLTALEGALV